MFRRRAVYHDENILCQWRRARRHRGPKSGYARVGRAPERIRKELWDEARRHKFELKLKCSELESEREKSWAGLENVHREMNTEAGRLSGSSSNPSLNFGRAHLPYLSCPTDESKAAGFCFFRCSLRSCICWSWKSCVKPKQPAMLGGSFTRADAGRFTRDY